MVTADAMVGGVFIALGSNLGDRERHIRDALRELDELPGVRVVRSSSLHETGPVGGPAGQPRYLNSIAELHTCLSPPALLERLLEIERRHGRTRIVRHGPRTLDLDLLRYGVVRWRGPDLRVPHPRMWERPFVLEPLRELVDDEQLEAWRRCDADEGARAGE
jgi:2-amino-4-hydroxy-6-hydroxymethyldihydropteridine diphosphokinase